MIKLKDFLLGFNTEKAINRIVDFFVFNQWFGEKIIVIDDSIMITDKQAELFKSKLDFFLNGNSNDLFSLFETSFPRTSKLFYEFLSVNSFSEKVKFYLVDFLVHRLNKELPDYNDFEMDLLVHNFAIFDLTKGHGDTLTFFLAWTRQKTKTLYTKDYNLNPRFVMTIQKEAYSFDDYIQLLYYLFVDDYIEEHEMFVKAANSKNYTDTWLFLAIHFVRPLRMPDYERLHHPFLPCPAEEVIDRIKNNTFSDYDARSVLLSISNRMTWLPLSPTKTIGASGVTEIVFDIPVSCEVFFGKLFALAQAHRDIIGQSNAPIIRHVSTYDQINRYMGDEIGSLFLHRDFSSRSATKSFLQEICMITDEEFDAEYGGVHIKGYVLAALARSHGWAYGEFAETTYQYLKDAKMNNLSSDFVAFELLQRGVFSFTATMLLKMVYKNNFEMLPPPSQTEIIKILDLSPLEIDTLVTSNNKAKRLAIDALKQSILEGKDILEALHRIGAGEAFSKQPGCLCLLSALHKVCPFTDNMNCVSCDLELSTRAVFYLLIDEYNRMHELYITASSDNEKSKYHSLLLSTIIPKLDEILFSIRENYGEDVFHDYEIFLKEHLK